MDESPRPVERSPADALRLIVASIVLVAIVAFELLIGDAAVDFVEELFDGLDALPRWLLEGIVVAARIGFVAALLVGLVSVVTRRQWRLLKIGRKD